MSKQTYAIAFVITFVLIFFVSTLLFIRPTKPLEPKFNFIYSNYDVNYEYRIKDKKLIKDCVDSMSFSSTTPQQDIQKAVEFNSKNKTCNSSNPYNNVKFSVHDVKSNVSREVSFEEAIKFSILDQKTSPDGLRFEPNYNSGNYGIGSGLLPNNNSQYPALVNAESGQSLKLKIFDSNNSGGMNYGGYNSFSSASFVGWIE
jgi:hypothetical protein